jgi:nicotinamide-nucleotide amidase
VIDAQTRALVERVLAACRARKWTIATAESCTGGLVAGALTEIAGSSDVVDRAFVTYSTPPRWRCSVCPKRSSKRMAR